MKLKIQKRFLETFSEDDIKSVRDYYEVLKLNKKSVSKIEIQKQLRINIHKVYSWISGRTKPVPVTTFEIAKKRGYFTRVSNEDLEWLAYLVGYNLGDGNISRNFCHTWFYGVNSDLEKIKRRLLRFGVSPKVYTYKINNGKMAVCDRVFSRFLCSLGAVDGDKTKSNYIVPNWIFKSKKCSVFKKRFLQGLCDSELSKITLIKNNRFSFQSLKFYMIKEKNHISKGIAYLNQLCKLFSEFNVTTTDVKEDRRYIRGRDDGRMVQLYFIIHSNYINLSNFLSNLGFLYTTKRIIDKKLLSKIKSHAKFEMEKIRKYHQVLKLRKKGFSAYKIAKKLNFPLHLVRYWTYYKGKPRSLPRKGH